MKSYDLDRLLVGRWYRSFGRKWSEGQIKEVVKTDLYAGEGYRVYKIRFGELNNWATISVYIGEE